MRNTLHVMFYIKRSATLRNGKTPIVGRITINGLRSQFSTKLTIHPSAWDVTQNRAIGRSADLVRINRELDFISTEVQRCYEELRRERGRVLPSMVRSRFLDESQPKTSLLEYFRQHNAAFRQQVGIDRSPSTYYKYRSVALHLAAFIPRLYGREDLALCELNRDFLVAFHGYLLCDMQCRKNTVWVYFTALKHLLTKAYREGLMRSDLFADYKIRSEFVARHFLTTDELNRLIALNPPGRSLQIVRDSFLFSCFTGLSFVDLKQLRLHHIRRIGEVCWIETTRQKTGSPVQIRLFELPAAILAKYTPRDPESPIFPLPSNSWCNACLAQLMPLAGITRRITFHAARHTFATTLTLSQGMPIETISKLLGHRNIRTTQIYATVTHDLLDHEMSRLSKRLDALYVRWRA